MFGGGCVLQVWHTLLVLRLLCLALRGAHCVLQDSVTAPCQLSDIIMVNNG